MRVLSERTLKNRVTYLFLIKTFFFPVQYVCSSIWRSGRFVNLCWGAYLTFKSSDSDFGCFSYIVDLVFSTFLYA